MSSIAPTASSFAPLLHAPRASIPAPGAPIPAGAADVSIAADGPASRRSPGALCPDPIFILGAPRSGTSILVWALAQHPELWGGPESNLLHHLFGDGQIETVFEALHDQHGSSWLREAGVGRGELLRHLGLGVNALFSSVTEGRRWIDKSLPNTLMADVIAEMFPRASFIHIVRDGRQVVHSMIHAGFPDPTVSDFPSACRTWRTFVEHADAFCTSHPSRSLTVSYERLVAAPDREFRRIQRFLGLDRDDGSAAYFRSHRVNSSFASAPGSPAERSPAACWAAWTDEQRRIFWDEAAATLREYCRVPLDELEAMRPPGAAPLTERPASTVASRAADRAAVAEPSATRSLQQQLRERTAWAVELAAALEHRDATIRSLMAAHDEQAVRARRLEARLHRLERSLTVRLYRVARRILPACIGGYAAAR
jgi:hypothetical protein